MGKPEGNRPLGRPGRKWEHNIKTDLQEMGMEGVEQIDLTLYRDRQVAGSCEQGTEPSGFITGGEFEIT